ncbi:HisA/HisF-related TIM barrel protein [Nonomuraea sp. NPDC050404]|uniref:HisA/HisF-related TIM barrel protein n=1 Tax=Nonomuraea sp. NPDC050404 TaxID=3155783 RepID=UPI0033CDF2B7
MNDLIIPCIDVAGGRASPSSGISELSDAADAVEIASFYLRDAGGPIFVDVQEPWTNHETFLPLIRALNETGGQFWVTVDNGYMPSADAAELLLKAGAAAVGLSTTSVEHPSVLHTLAQRQGPDRVLGVMNVARAGEGRWNVAIRGGGQGTDLDAVVWAKMLADLGAGHLLANSLDREGTGSGYDLEMTSAIATAVSVPVIASGGAGTVEHLYEGLTVGGARHALVNNLFHSGAATVGEAYEFLDKGGLRVSPEGTAE